MSVAPSVPAGFVTQLSAFDPQALVLALQEGFLEHVQLEQGRFGGQIVHSVSAQCRTDWGQYNLALLAKGDLSREWLSVGVFLQGQGSWRVQGQKIWTSLALESDWIFVLARCEPGSKGNKGLAFLLMPLRQPGIEIRPIRQLGGGSEFNDGKFAPEASGDIIAIFTTNSALIVYPGKDDDNDEVWTPYPKRVPAAGTEVTVIITPFSNSKPLPKP